MSRDAPPDGKTIKSAETTLDVLEGVRDRDGVGVTALAADLGYSKSTVHYYLKTLEHRGYVVRVDGEFRLGLRLLELGGRAQASSALYRAARGEVDDLGSETGLVARLVVADRGDGVVVHETAGPAERTADWSLGRHLPLHATASGKAILAHLPDERRAALLDGDLAAYTDRTLTDHAALQSDLEAVREFGVAFVDGELTEGERAIAAPIQGPDAVLGAVEVVGTTDEITDPWKGGKARRFAAEIPQQTRRVARIVADAVSR